MALAMDFARSVVRRVMPATVLPAVFFGFAVCGFSLLAAPLAAHAADSATAAATKPVDQKRIVELIAQLGADDYFDREKAQAELTAIGPQAFDSLSDALDSQRDVEILGRAAYLLHLIKVEWNDKNDAVEVRNLMQNYEGMDDESRKDVIDKLAQLPDLKPINALCRVIRFERSPALSKRAAVRLIDRKAPTGEDWSAREKALQTALGTSPRPGAEWVRTFILTKHDPAKAVESLRALTDTEMEVLRKYPQRSGPEILMSLWRKQADLLTQLDRRKEAIAAMMQMVSLEQSGTTTVLSEVLQWLVDNQAWTEIDDLAVRFAARFDQDPLLMYSLAGARKAQGKLPEATEIVARAKKLNPDDQRRHLIIGLELHKRGMIEWSEGEYRDAVGMGTPGQVLTLTAQFLLSESLHDRKEDQEAGKVLDAATKGMEAAQAQGLDFSEADRTIEANRARAHYFYALHFLETKDSKAALKHLLEGLGEDQYDAEILIALYNVPDLDASLRDRVRKLIRESAENYRKQIQETPNSDTPYNQLAWLLSNTEGDFQEALKASQKSLEIRPENAGHLDTLGRCYFALGDFENAVKSQTRAIELEPYSQQMRRQLKLFQEAKEKKGAKS